MLISNKKKGFTLLIAVLVSGIVLSIGLAILNITLKTYKLSIVARESNYAFYTADSILECMFYWDGLTAGTPFVSETEPGGTGDDSNIECDGTSINITTTLATANVGASQQRTYTTLISPIQTASFCGTAEITKVMGVSTSTTIIARGRNTCTVSAETRVERALRAVY